MSIDAVVERIRHTDGGLRLELAPRVGSDGQDSIPGTSVLTIYGERTFEPQVGMQIWGGSPTVVIVDGPKYDRKGQRLRERRKCPRCSSRMHWAELSNTETGRSWEAYLCDACEHQVPI